MTLPHTNRAIIEVNGRQFDSWHDGPAYFKGVEINLSSGAASECEWRIFDPDSNLLRQFLTGEDLMELTVKARLGFGIEVPNSPPIFEGILTSAEWERDTIILRSYDNGYRMRKAKETEYHRNLDDVQIIEKLAKQNGLSFEGPTPAIKLDRHKSLIQDGQTDWEFATERAENAGLVLYVRRNTLYAKEAAKTSPPILTLTYGQDFILSDGINFRYRAPENVEGRPGRVEVRARGKGGRRITGRSDENRRGVRHVELRNDLPIKTKRSADRRAQARKDIQREHAFTGSIKLLPTFEGRWPDIRDTVLVKGIGPLFGGKYICGEVAHSFGPGVIETTLDLYRDIRGA
ncbi:MAG TPA: hypothetical protein VIP46_22110 [Pyrinomonadaceae bacterium]